MEGRFVGAFGRRCVATDVLEAHPCALGRRLAGYDYDRHFGGIRYLFLRGMDPQRGGATGVFADRPSRAVIDRLDALFAGGPR